MRKHILILGHDYTTQFVDIFNQYTRLFDKEKYAVTVAYLTGEPNEEIRQRTLAEQVIFLNIPKKSIRGLKITAIKQLRALSLQHAFQIVICHRYKPTYIMLWVAKFCKIPLIISVMHELKTMTSWKRQWFLAAFAGKNTVFAGVSNAVRDDMRQSLWCIPKERIVTLYNMIDIELTEPQLLSKEAARQALSLSEQAFVFGTLGRLVKNKNQKSLIQAFAQIKVQCPQAKLVIIGTGELEAQLKSQVNEAHLNDDVIFTGFLANGFRYMKAFDCFVLSSIQEAFGRVLLEAMIAKLPIIATRAHGIPEVVADAGILVNPNQPQELAQGMQKIYELSQEKRLLEGNKSYEHAKRSFSIPVFKQQFWNTLDAISVNQNLRF
jgi:glycosyltransferase involved in cell wall biosynthesis